MFLDPFWWYLCPRTLDFVEAHCSDVSPTSSSALCGQPAPNPRLPGCLVFGLEDGSCPRPTASAHSTAVALSPVLPYLYLCSYPYLYQPGRAAPKHGRRARGSAPAAARPATQRLGLPTAIFVILPFAISRRILPPVASRRGPASAFTGKETQRTYSQCSSPSTCDLRPVYRKPQRGGQFEPVDHKHSTRRFGPFLSCNMSNLLRLTKQSSALSCHN